MLAVEQMHVGYYRGLSILRGVSVSASQGRITAILGANGVGKSTLLKSIFGFLPPWQGQVSLDGTDITGRPPHQMVRLGIAYSPQQPGVFPEMSVEENVLIGAWSFRNDGPRVRRKLEENYGRFPVLAQRQQAQAGQLSGGQRRMVELARSLMSEPKYLLVDEPSAGLAPIVADAVYDELRQLRQSGVGIVLVEQDIARALRVADYVYVIDLGENRAEGTPAQLGDVEAAFWTWSSPITASATQAHGAEGSTDAPVDGSTEHVTDASGDG